MCQKWRNNKFWKLIICKKQKNEKSYNLESSLNQLGFLFIVKFVFFALIWSFIFI